jgi:hypothetical protein
MKIKTAAAIAIIAFFLVVTLIIGAGIMQPVAVDQEIQQKNITVENKTLVKENTTIQPIEIDDIQINNTTQENNTTQINITQLNHTIPNETLPIVQTPNISDQNASNQTQAPIQETVQTVNQTPLEPPPKPSRRRTRAS